MMGRCDTDTHTTSAIEIDDFTVVGTSGADADFALVGFADTAHAPAHVARAVMLQREGSAVLTHASNAPFDVDTIDLALEGQGSELIEFRSSGVDGHVQTEVVEVAGGHTQRIALNLRGIHRLSWRRVDPQDGLLRFDRIAAFAVPESLAMSSLSP